MCLVSFFLTSILPFSHFSSLLQDILSGAISVSNILSVLVEDTSPVELLSSGDKALEINMLVIMKN